MVNVDFVFSEGMDPAFGKALPTWAGHSNSVGHDQQVRGASHRNHGHVLSASTVQIVSAASLLTVHKGQKTQIGAFQNHDCLR